MKRGNSHSRTSFRVVWDENNLDHLEHQKTPKEKIDEPKTPFHGPDAGDSSPSGEHESSSSVNADDLRNALENVASSSSSSSSSSPTRDHHGPGTTSSGSSSGSSTSSSSGISRRKSFEDIKKEHYSEFKNSKMIPQNVDDEEEESDRSQQLSGGVGGIKIEEKNSSSKSS